MSLTKRLIVSLTIFVTIFWIATAVISRMVIVAEINEIIFSDLSKAAYRLMPLVMHELGNDSGGSDHGDGPSDDEMQSLLPGQDGYLAFELRDIDGNVLLRSFDAEEFEFGSSDGPGFVENPDFISFTLVDGRTGVSLTVAHPEALREEAIAEASIALFSPLLLLIPLMIVAIFLMTRSILTPLRDLRRQISARGGSNLDAIDSANQPAELRPIALAIDRLLERLRDAMDAERAFAANSAHELRTPLAGALAQAQRLKEELADAPALPRAVKIEETLRRLSDFTEKLLQLSRAESGIGPQDTREDMGPVLDLVLDEFSGRTRSPAKIVVENNLHEDLLVAMDRDAFAISVRNLVENALIHGDGKEPVRLVIENDWSIHVINSGPAVAPEILTGLGERFARGDTLAGGSGLGLAIVDRIMMRCGGSLVLQSPRTGGVDGFEAILQLP